MSKYIVVIEYKLVVEAPDDFNAEHKAREQIDSFTEPYNIRAMELEEGEQP